MRLRLRRLRNGTRGWRLGLASGPTDVFDNLLDAADAAALGGVAVSHQDRGLAGVKWLLRSARRAIASSRSASKRVAQSHLSVRELTPRMVRLIDDDEIPRRFGDELVVRVEPRELQRAQHVRLDRPGVVLRMVCLESRDLGEPWKMKSSLNFVRSSKCHWVTRLAGTMISTRSRSAPMRARSSLRIRPASIVFPSPTSSARIRRGCDFSSARSATETCGAEVRRGSSRARARSRCGTRRGVGSARVAASLRTGTRSRRLRRSRSSKRIPLRSKQCFRHFLHAVLKLDVAGLCRALAVDFEQPAFGVVFDGARR